MWPVHVVTLVGERFVEFGLMWQDRSGVLWTPHSSPPWKMFAGCTPFAYLIFPVAVPQ